MQVRKQARHSGSKAERASSGRATGSGESTSPRDDSPSLKKLRRESQSARRVWNHLKASQDAQVLQFISTEIDLAQTFCDMADASEDPAASERRMGRAVEAYEAARHYMRKIQAPPEVRSQILQKLERLQKSLEKRTAGITEAPGGQADAALVLPRLKKELPESSARTPRIKS